MVKGDMVDYFGLSGYTSEELKKMGYFVWMPPQEKGSWLGEGDNHTFMNMLGNGLRAYERGSYGGWGGRSKTDTGPMFSFSGEGSADQMAQQLSNLEKTSSTDAIPFPDFFAKAQNSFAARMKWAVTAKFSDANHEPNVGIQGPLKIMANTGQKVKINGIVSDPDGNKVSVKWLQLPAGSYPNQVNINHSESLQTEIIVPKDATAGQTIHIVIEATDDGTPALTKYQRVIINEKKHFALVCPHYWGS
jgi:hypothetical protein